jgi:DNA mismatch endonuclease (patch repair protein)
MADTVSPEVRSRMMSRIRSQDTAPERRVRSFLHRHGLRFRKNDPRFPGRPDAVFQHPGCREGRIPDSNREYWEPKLLRTVQRDQQHRKAIENRGWRVLVTWECELEEGRLLELARRVTSLPDGKEAEG